jgi:hypothetical protein
MGIKYRGNSRDEQWRDRQRQKQRERQEVDQKSKEEAKEGASIELQEEPESQIGAVEAVEQGNPTEPDKATEPPQG